MLVSRNQRPVQLRVAFGGLGEGQALPRAEVRLDQVVVDGDVEAQRLGRLRRGVVGPLQRRRDDRGDATPLGRGSCAAASA